MHTARLQAGIWSVSSAIQFIRFFALIAIPVAASAQVALLQPAADRTLTNLVVGSNVAPDGTVSNTTDVYLLKSDGSQLRKLTAFSPAPGATAVAISPDGTRAAWIAVSSAGGVQEVHGFDIASGTDRLISKNLEICAQPLCPSTLSFSQDGTELVWQFDSGSAGSPVFRQINVAHFDGSSVLAMGLNGAKISNSPNITTSAGQLIFLNRGCSTPCEEVDTIGLDATGLTTLVPSPANVNPNFLDPVISSDGSHYAYSTMYTPMGGPFLPTGAIVVTPGTCAPAGGAFTYPGGLTISADGSQIAFLQNNQVRTCSGASIPQTYLQAVDVLLAADGSKMLYSVGQGDGQRTGVWMADANGGNAHPAFAPHSINSRGIVGLGSAPGYSLPLSPGSYFTIYGSNFANTDSLVTAPTIPFLTTLAGVTVAVNGIAVPVQAVTPFQINAILPQSFATGPATVTVGFADGSTVKQSVTVARSAAAISTYVSSFGPNPDAAAFHAGTATPADLKNPASPGEILETYGFGLGATTPTVADGAAAPLNPPAITSFPAVSIGPVFANVTFAGLVPGLVGVYQVNVMVPNLAAGAYELRWATIDPASGPAGYIWVN